MSPVVSHRPISITLAVAWLAVEAVGSVALALLVTVGTITMSASASVVGTVVLFVAFAALIGTGLRLVVAAGLYTLQSWARPASLGFFGFFVVFDGALYALEFAVPGLPPLAFALIGAANLCFFFTVLMQPGAFNPTRLGGPDGTATSSSPHR